MIKNKFKLTLISLLFLSSWANTQSLETKLQAVIDRVYAANPASVGIMVHVESPEHGISWSGVSGYPYKDAKTMLEPDQPALIASSIKTYVSATILRLVEEGNLSIDQPINNLLSDKTRSLFIEGGYKLDSIEIKHLLSHTSGIQNYANQAYVDFINENKEYRWTRDEQLELTIKTGPPLGKPGTTFNYTDANYLLATEIIEGLTGLPFYTAMRELLQYEAIGINNTWFPTLEEKPKGTKSLVHQYWDKYNWDSHDIDISFDLYGGGGIACNTFDLAHFNYALFNNEIIKDTAILNLIFTEVQTTDGKSNNYYLGITSYEYQGFKAYGHGGFWGTIALYFPELKSSISVYILEKDMNKLRQEIVDQAIGILVE